MPVYAQQSNTSPHFYRSTCTTKLGLVGQHALLLHKNKLTSESTSTSTSSLLLNKENLPAASFIATANKTELPGGTNTQK